RRPVPVLLLYRSQRWGLTVAVSVMPVMLCPFVAFVPFTAPAAIVRRSVVIGAVGRVIRCRVIRRATVAIRRPIVVAVGWSVVVGGPVIIGGIVAPVQRLAKPTCLGRSGCRRTDPKRPNPKQERSDQGTHGTSPLFRLSEGLLPGSLCSRNRYLGIPSLLNKRGRRFPLRSPVP